MILAGFMRNNVAQIFHQALRKIVCPLVRNQFCIQENLQNLTQL